ncbi:hypothetical protein PRR77_26610, partial [Klebsiella pneumoniae]|nr:hypothetical protein [Klebsiella pneumoniae]
MKNNLPPFIEIYRALIATPSISATEEALDQSNESFNAVRQFFYTLFISIGCPLIAHSGLRSLTAVSVTLSLMPAWYSQ